MAVFVVATLLLVVVGGCQFGGRGAIVASPLSTARQEQEIQAIVPLGTPRDEVVRRLEEAGVQGNFGVSESVFYCDLWNRPTGERWHINVALLFDQSGQLYKTRPAQTQTTLVGGSAGSDRARSSSEDSGGAEEAAPANGRSQDERRTPFVSNDE